MKNNFKLLHLAALCEGSSLLALLFVAVPLKYWANMPIAVKIVGPIHGVLFLVFVGILLFHFLKSELNLVKTLAGLVAAFLPFGTFVYKAKMLS